MEGILVNPYNTSSMMSMEEIDPSVFFIIDKMEVEEEFPSQYWLMIPRQPPGYKLVKLNKRTESA